MLEMIDDSISDCADVNYINDGELFSKYIMLDKFFVNKINIWCDLPATFCFYIGSFNFGCFTGSGSFEKDIAGLLINANQNFHWEVKSDYPQKVRLAMFGKRYREII